MRLWNRRHRPTLGALSGHTGTVLGVVVTSDSSPASRSIPARASSTGPAWLPADTHRRNKTFEAFPAQPKQAVLEPGGFAQFAGGVPAMCDGITPGRDGMQLSLGPGGRPVGVRGRGDNVHHAQLESGNRLESTQGG